MDKDLRFIDGDNQFICRASTIIFNKDKTKFLLFNVENRDFWILPGGKIKFNETSLEAIKREIKEELGWNKVDFSFLGLGEEFNKAKGYNNHQISIIYKGIYDGEIIEEEFNGLDGDWCKYKWFDINDVDSINIKPNYIVKAIKNNNDKNHFIERM